MMGSQSSRVVSGVNEVGRDQARQRDRNKREPSPKGSGSGSAGGKASDGPAAQMRAEDTVEWSAGPQHSGPGGGEGSAPESGGVKRATKGIDIEA